MGHRHAGHLARRDHRILSGTGVRASSGPVTVHRYPPASGPPRLGVAIGAKVGPAVLRNRIRRRLRAASREISWSGAAIASGTREAATIEFSSLVRHFERAIVAAGERLHGASA